MEETPVVDFFKGRDVFITGASGLMGKVLVEKLLFSCPEIGRIYMLMRPKRGKFIDVRLEEMWRLPMFSRIREKRPEVMKKVVAVQGDVLFDNLGIDSTMLQDIESNVSVVYHFAATLRLEAELKDAIDMNTSGTRRLLDICKRIKNLVAVVHLSTAFCYPDYEQLDEKVHAPPHNPHDLMHAAQWLSAAQLNSLTPSLLQAHPNSYTYSKRLAEALVNEAYPELPVCIARPGIVTPAYAEPVVGWVDSLNGPIGVMVGAGKGVIRSMHCIGEYHAEVIPVDMAINALITIAHRIGTQRERSAHIPVFNITTGDVRNTTWKEVLDMGKQTVRKLPFELPLWYPDGNIHSSLLVHRINVFLFHIIPAYFIDFLMLVFLQKRFLVRIQNRISIGLGVLQYFTTREWWFNTDNFKDLYVKLTPKEKEIFPMDMTIIDDRDYIEKCMIGGRIYCLKEPLSNLPKARLQNNIVYVLDCIVKVLFYCYIIKSIIYYTGASEGITFLKAMIMSNELQSDPIS